MNARAMMVFGLSLVVSGCNEPGQPLKGKASPERNSFNQQIRALHEPARNLAFRNAVRDFKVKCERVDRSAYQQDLKGGAMWVAHCTDTGDYAIFVSASGYAQIARCEDLPANNVPGCTALG